jgi:Lon protease-like protein
METVKMEPKYNSADDKAVVRVDKNNIPGAIPILPLDKQVAFPTLNLSLAVTTRATPLLETAMKGDHLIGVVGTKSRTGAARRRQPQSKITGACDASVT